VKRNQLFMGQANETTHHARPLPHMVKHHDAGGGTHIVPQDRGRGWEDLVALRTEAHDDAPVLGVAQGAEADVVTPDVPATRALAPLAPRHKMLSLDELTPEQEEAVLKGVNIDRLKAEANRRLLAESEDFDALVSEWLRTRKSPQTARRYRNAVRKWMAWCEAHGITPILAEPKDADLFAAELTGAPATVNSTISGASSLYSTLVKWRKISATPFTKISRRSMDAGQHEIPTAAEVKAILVSTTGTLHTAIVLMSYRGFRIGALAGITVNGTRFSTISKGKSWRGELPRTAVSAIKDLGSHPFKGIKQGTIAAHFKRVTKRLAAAGTIAHAYSVHDLRHYYAVQEYKKDKDIYRVSRLLNHADVKVTMGYLQSLGAMK
jgi:site-specific recombinase XerD